MTQMAFQVTFRYVRLRAAGCHKYVARSKGAICSGHSIVA
jgi:hypothetical protein